LPSGDIEIVRAKTEGDFRAIGELRYRCYRAEGLIDENPNGIFLDEFDHAPGRARLWRVPERQDRQFDPASCPAQRATRSATREAFSDILEPMIAAGMVLVDGARFVVDPSIGSARLSIAWQTLNICLRVADAIDADYGVAAVQRRIAASAQRVGRAGQAGIIGADRDLHMVQHAFGDLRLARDVRTATSARRGSCLVVVGRRDDEVAIGDLVVLIDLVMVDEVAARRLDDADAFCPGAPGCATRSVPCRSGSSSSSRIFSTQCTTSIMRAQ
jgi:hypothetical protein